MLILIADRGATAARADSVHRRFAGTRRVTPDGEWDNKDMAWIDLEGAVNVRDVGGMPTADGGETAQGRLLRSENLQELTARDIALLVGELGVTTVVDLRSTRELMTEGPAPLDAVDGVQHAHHPVLKEYLDASDTVAAALLLTAQQEDSDRYPDDLMTGHYLGYLENRPEEVVGALRSIVNAPGAAIVHCAAGKDRTGVIVALALTIAGVEPELIVADYTATNERIEAIIERLSRATMYGGVTAKPVRAHEARAETMRAFLEQLDARYGGLKPWLSNHGFTDDEVAALRARLRQP
jgi:protein-tyrosine phosphatase